MSGKQTILTDLIPIVTALDIILQAENMEDKDDECVLQKSFGMLRGTKIGFYSYSLHIRRRQLERIPLPAAHSGCRH